MLGVLTAGCGAGHSSAPTVAAANPSSCHTGWSTCMTQLAGETAAGVLGPRVESGDVLTSARVAPEAAAQSLAMSYQYSYAGIPGAMVSVIAVSPHPLVVRNYTSFDQESWTTIRGHRGVFTVEPSTGRHLFTWIEQGREWSVGFSGEISEHDARADVAHFTAYGA
jgi:hypothetical protein